MNATSRSAFDLSREPMATLECFGGNLFGDSVLLARRLVEAEGNLHHDPHRGAGQWPWGTHNNKFKLLALSTVFRKEPAHARTDPWHRPRHHQ
jgi:hypothetical protein